MKRLLAGKPAAHLLVQPGHAQLKHSIELLLFRLDDSSHASGRVNQFRVRLLHQVANSKDHLVEKRLLLAEEAAMPDAATENFAEDVAAAFVCGDDAVVDEEGGCAGVIGNDSEAGVFDETLHSLRG